MVEFPYTKNMGLCYFVKDRNVEQHIVEIQNFDIKM
jgi:hypothetical protein